MNNLNISFALGFIIGSIFNLFVIWWFHNKIYLPQNHNISDKKLLKEIEEKLRQQKDEQLKDLSLTIKNLHINHQEKEKKNEEKNHFSLIHHD